MNVILLLEIFTRTHTDIYKYWNYLLMFYLFTISSTLSQFCARLKTALFCRVYETLAQRLRDSLGCKVCCANTNVLTYLLTYIVTSVFCIVMGCACQLVIKENDDDDDDHDDDHDADIKYMFIL